MNGQAAVLTPHSSHNFSFDRQCYVDLVGLSSLFSVAAGGGSGGTLSAFQRILLTNDGTITDLIEIYTGESIKVKKLSETIVQLNDGLLPMQLDKGAEVLERKVLLQGGSSERNYLYAESIIALEKLDLQVKEKLLTTEKPIGKIWIEDEVKIFKETIESGKVPAQELAPHFNIAPKENLLFRTYRVTSNQKYIMTITEKFPEGYFIERL